MDRTQTAVNPLVVTAGQKLLRQHLGFTGDKFERADQPSAIKDEIVARFSCTPQVAEYIYDQLWGKTGET